VHLTKDTVLVLEDEVQLPRFWYAWPTPKVFSPDDAVLDVLGFVLAAVYYFLAPPSTRLAPFSDDEYVKAAVASAPGQAFAQKYPEATRTVDRAAGIVVDLGVARNGHTLDLRLYMDAFANRVLEANAYCDRVQQLLDPIEYLKTERCLAA
jgi:hypothetical protein